jgi:hypothetical protein
MHLYGVYLYLSFLSIIFLPFSPILSILLLLFLPSCSLPHTCQLCLPALSKLQYKEEEDEDGGEKYTEKVIRKRMEKEGERQ